MRSASRRVRFSLPSQELLDAPVAVAKAVLMNTRFFEQRQVKIRQRRRLRVMDVSCAFVASGHDERQVRMVVHRWVAETAAYDVSRMIQQRTVAIRRGFQFAQQVREE